jgi:hypothetical protein
VKYALLAYARPGAWDELTDAERVSWLADDAAFNVELGERDIVVHGNGLAEADTATTVRVRDGEALLTDGPFAEITEHLGGFLVIDVPDLDTALEVARRCPAARIGPLEVRPVRFG